MAEEECFPRGKAPRIPSSVPTKKPKLQMDRPDNLFRENPTVIKERPEKSKDRKRKSDLEGWPEAAREEIESDESRMTSVDYLTFKKFHEGMLILGCVKEIFELEIMLSLPNCNTGFVKANRISTFYTNKLQQQLQSIETEMESIPALSELFYVGQLVVCSVCGLNPITKSIQLSLDPQAVNEGVIVSNIKNGQHLSGVVKSIEDHGYIVDIGKKNVNAFIPFKQADPNKTLVQGNVIRCLVTKVKSDGKILTLSNDSRKINKSITKSEQEITLDSLLPGTLVKFKCTKQLPRGQIGNFLEFQGSVAILHSLPFKKKKKEVTETEKTEENNSEGEENSEPIKKRKKKGSKNVKDELQEADTKVSKTKKLNFDKDDNVVACILYVNVLKHVALATNPKLWRDEERLELLSSNKDNFLIGQKCKFSVKHKLKGIGLVGQLDNNGPTGIILIKHLSDNRIDVSMSELVKKKSYKAKVIQNCNIEGILELTLKKSMLEAAFLRYEDVKIGGVVQAKVMAINHRGLLVKIGSGKDEEFRGCGNLKGFVSNLHISDIVLQHPEKKYAVSDVINCRVLSVDPKRRHIQLTCKPTLLKSKLPVVTNYTDITIGQIVHGYITVIKDYGVILKLYDDICGLVPKTQLSAEVVENPQKVFFIGQVMRARVLSCEPELNNLKLSFCLSQTEKKNVDKPKTTNLVMPANKIVSVKVTDKEKDFFKVLIINNDIPSEEWISARLYKEHLSDFLTISQELFSTISVGSVLEDCVTYIRKSSLNVSMKRSLFNFSTSRIETPLVFADLQEGQIIPGFIQQVVQFGAFIDISNNLVGLCPKSMLTDYYLETTTDQFYDGQSVIAKVSEVNLEKQRFLLSLRPSECKEKETRIVEYNSQRNKVVELGNMVLKDLKIGTVVDISCNKNDDDQEVVTINGLDIDYTCVLLDKQEPLDKAVVVHVDVVEQQIFLTNQQLVLNYYENLPKQKKSTNGVVYVDMIYINDDISIGYINKDSNNSGFLVMVATNLHSNNSKQFDRRILKIGQTIKSEIVKKMDDGFMLGTLKLKPGVGTRIRQDSEMSDSGGIENNFKDIKVGQKVVGQVKSIRATCALIYFDSLTESNKQVTGRLHVSEILKDVKDKTLPMKNLKVGQTISCYVIGCRDVKTHYFLDITNNRRAARGVLELSLFRPKAEFEISDTQTLEEIFSVGSYVTTYVKTFDKKHKCFQTEVIPGVKALLPRLFVSDDPTTVEKARTRFKPGMGIKCHVLKNDGSTLYIAKTGAFVDSTTGDDVTTVGPGSVMNVDIRKIINDGLLVHGEFDIQGKVFLTDLFDEFCDKPLKSFTQGQTVRCCVVDNSNPTRLHLSLKKSAMQKDITPTEHVTDIKSLKPKQIVQGYIKSCSPSGIFVSLSRDVSGRVTFRKASKYYISEQKEAEKIFYPGKLVKCCVIRIHTLDGKVELSMLSRDTKEDDIIPSSMELPLRNIKRKVDDAKENIKSPKIAKITSKAIVERLIKETKIKSDEVQVETTSVSQNDDVMENSDVIKEPGFVWDDKEEELVGSSNGEDSGIEDNVQQKKRNKGDDEKNEEREIMKRERELMDGERAPQSAADWERMMISNPQSSLLWVRYMAFHLHLTETDKARAVAQKALKTINFREEQEKLNVWVALLNLENLYGTELTLEQTLERAMQQNDQLKVLTHLANIFNESGKSDEADETYQKMLKKFRKNKEVWIAYLKYLMKNKNFDQANSILKKSTEALEKKQHLEVISKFAQFEFTFGEQERGKTMFENALLTYPKRTDVWSMYVDTLIKAKRIEDARNVLDRVTTITISSKKIRSFFKRFVEFETKYGTEENVNKVKQKAIDYIEGQTNKGMGE